ncbi:hypothetical protein PIB30_057241 [Stylosanthes scabra]|uniref:Uncharacterized protein n=1 Tax=Stylosanthes scabra TaxID=79078 RepID=A0ABU6RJK7_9FABA|nr:hypothetical protein [Stylosanthes scabra]
MEKAPSPAGESAQPHFPQIQCRFLLISPSIPLHSGWCRASEAVPELVSSPSQSWVQGPRLPFVAVAAPYPCFEAAVHPLSRG